MGRLLYTAITSLDGYVADAAGSFERLAPDREVHAFINDLERDTGTYLCGRRLYDVMVVWETMPTTDEPAEIVDYAQIWRAADKVVFSTTLDQVRSRRTTLLRSFEADAVRRLVSAAHRDVSIGGPHLAAAGLEAGLVDEVQLFLSPVVFGGGNRALPEGLRATLDLLDERRFANGVVFLRYAVSSSPR